MSAVNITAPLETASERERFQFYRRLTTRLMRTEETEVDTSDATSTRLWSRLMPENSVMTIYAVVVSLRSDGAEAAGYHRWATFQRVGSAAAAAVGVQTILAHESDTSWNSTIAAGSPTGTVELLVTGDAATDISWEASVTFKIKAL